MPVAPFQCNSEFRIFVPKRNFHWKSARFHTMRPDSSGLRNFYVFQSSLPSASLSFFMFFNESPTLLRTIHTLALLYDWVRTAVDPEGQAEDW